MGVEIVSIEYAVEVGEDVHWFTGYINALYFAFDHNTDLIQKTEYGTGDKHYRNLMTGEEKML